MLKCIVCEKELVGRRKRFCSDKCRNTDSNRKNQSYVCQKERALQRKKKLILMKGGKCSVCGYKKNYAALCFHHLDPSKKEFKLDGRSLGNRTWPVTVSEVEKCILVCQNCHAEIHHPQLSLKHTVVDISGCEHILPIHNFCCDCGRLLSYNDATRCVGCQSATQEKIEWPPTEELLKMLETLPYLEVGRRLGVSDNAVRKRIKNHPI
jgi:hypothetical protein